MQQYFQSGKTLVIDDQYSEAKPLLDALNRSQIPFLYTQGKPHSEFPLPNIDPKDAKLYNLIFLDLNLDFKFAGGISNVEDEKTFKSTHAGIFELVIKNRNKSFVLVIWSNEEENYKDHFIKIFDSKERYSTKKIPYKIISLSKSDFFSLQKDGTYQFIAGKDGDLKERINEQLKELDAFKFFCEWDRVVSQSVSNTIDDFMFLIDSMKTEEEREIHLAEILTALCIAYSGEEGFLSLKSDEERSDSVFLALTQILNDDIDRNVLYNRQNVFTKWKAKNQPEIKSVLAKINKSKLNTKLLIYNPNKKQFTGSVYIPKSSPNFLTRILKDSINVQSAFKKVKEKSKLKYKKGRENDQHKDSNSETFIKYIASKCIAIELNITPLCDIVQGKYINHRLVSGFIAPAFYYDCIKNSDLPFFCHTPIFSYNLEDCFIGIDLRTFTSCLLENIDEKEYLFSLRTNLINDIQTKLAAHVSRLGVFNL